MHHHQGPHSPASVSFFSSHFSIPSPQRGPNASPNPTLPQEVSCIYERTHNNYRMLVQTPRPPTPTVSPLYLPHDLLLTSHTVNPPRVDFKSAVGQRPPVGARSPAGRPPPSLYGHRRGDDPVQCSSSSPPAAAAAAGASLLPPITHLTCLSLPSDPPVCLHTSR